MTPTYQAVAAIIGENAARILCERLGGLPLYVPQAPHAQHQIVLAIGHAKTARLCDEFAGQHILLPTRNRIDALRRRDEIEYDIRRGMHPLEIARRHGVSVRRIFQIREQAQ